VTAPTLQRRDLTLMELTILRAHSNGLTVGEIAEALERSRYTVRTHSGSILRKLHVRSMTHAVAVALREGLIT
jgi:DNA-binding NarL/FixJ family response regulator